MAPRLLPNPWSATIPLVRPLLGIWRSEILEYCAEQELAPIYDASNESLTFFRNRLRNQLLPKLEEFSPGLKTRLHHSAELLQADYAVLENLAEEAWLRCLAQRGEQFLAIDRRAFLEEPLALRRSILRRAAAELRPVHRDVGFDDIERALSYLGDPTPSAKDWLAGLYILAEENLVWIADWQAALPVAWPQAPIHEQHVEVPTNIELNNGWHLQLNESRSAAPPAETNNDPYQAWLDLDMTGDELILRRRKPGDRFQPLGMESGSLKLADFMINEKMPARARAGWPLLCKGEEIVWVPGYRMAHAVRLRPESHRALHVQVAK